MEKQWRVVNRALYIYLAGTNNTKPIMLFSRKGVLTRHRSEMLNRVINHHVILQQKGSSHLSQFRGVKPGDNESMTGPRSVTAHGLSLNGPIARGTMCSTLHNNSHTPTMPRQAASPTDPFPHARYSLTASPHQSQPGDPTRKSSPVGQETGTPRFCFPPR